MALRVPPQPRSSTSQAIGVGMVLVSTIAIAIVPTFARLAYDGGSNTLSVITARSISTVALTWLLMASMGQSARIKRRPLAISMATGVCYAVMLYGFLGAVAFIPVNTVILIYFIHPFLVGLCSAWLGHEAITFKTLAALAGACMGLGLAVGFTFDHLNLTGLLLAVLAMLTCVGVFIGNGQALRQASGLIVVFYMMLSAAVTLTLLFAFFGTWAAPTTSMGWLGFAGVAVGSTVGTLTFFCALPMIGAVRAAMISNVEPLLGIVFAVAILGEHISLIQAAGIALVLASIVAMEMLRSGQSVPND
jgi:drug/metabolite transporter (DMT)-like permease